MIELESVVLMLEIARTMLPADLYESMLVVAVEWTVEHHPLEDAVKAYRRLDEEEMVIVAYVEQGLY